MRIWLPAQLLEEPLPVSLWRRFKVMQGFLCMLSSQIMAMNANLEGVHSRVYFESTTRSSYLRNFSVA